MTIWPAGHGTRQSQQVDQNNAASDNFPEQPLDTIDCHICQRNGLHFTSFYLTTCCKLEKAVAVRSFETARSHASMKAWKLVRSRTLSLFPIKLEPTKNTPLGNYGQGHVGN